MKAKQTPKPPVDPKEERRRSLRTLAEILYSYHIQTLTK